MTTVPATRLAVIKRVQSCNCRVWKYTTHFSFMEMKLPNLIKLSTATHTVSMDFYEHYGGGSDSDEEKVAPPKPVHPRPNMKDWTVKEHAKYALDMYGSIVDRLNLISDVMGNPSRVESSIDALEELLKEASAIVAGDGNASHAADPENVGDELVAHESDVKEARYLEKSIRNELYSIYRSFNYMVEEVEDEHFLEEASSDEISELVSDMDNVGILSGV